MKKLLQILLFVSSVVSPCFAQSSTKGQWQLFAGYSYMRANVREYFKPSPSLYAVRNQYANLNGWEVSVTENVKKWFGGTLDASGHYSSPQIGAITTNQQAYSLLYGPHFFHQGKKWRPFAHVLLGITHINSEVPSPGPSISNTSFAIVPGGGLDMHLFSRGSIRWFQVDYLHANLEGSSNSHLRASAGLVFDLNKK
jgi:hypothetical protein